MIEKVPRRACHGMVLGRLWWQAADDDVRRVEWSMIAICVSYLVVMVAVRIDVRIRLSVWEKTKGSVVRKVQRVHESYISRPNLEV